MKISKKIILAALITAIFLALAFPVTTAFSSSRPTIVISEPASSVVTTNYVQIKGYVTETSILKISVNGYQQTVSFDSNGFFSYRAEGLIQGNNTITVNASGTYQSTSSLTVIYDPGAVTPELNVTNINDNDEVNQGTFNLAISAANTASLDIKVNGTVSASVNLPAAPLNQTVNLNQLVNLSPGINNVELIGTTSGITVTKLLRIRYAASSALTDIRVDAVPVSDYIHVTGNSVTLTGKAAVGTSVSIKLNGSNAGSYPGGSFTSDLTLTTGINSVLLSVTGQGVNEQRQISVYYGPQGPQLYSVTPSGTVYGPNLTITGTVRQAHKVTLTLDNGVSVSRDVSGSFDAPVAFSIPVSLSPGKNTWVITATNNYDNVTQTFPPSPAPPYEIYYQNKPSVIIESPLNNAVVYSNTVTVSGRVFNTSNNGLTVNGSANSFSGSDGSFVRNVTLKPGINVITVSAKNSAGDTAVSSVSVEYRGGPNLLNLSPSDGSVVSGEAVILSGNVTNVMQNGLKVFINGDTQGASVSFDSSGRFNYSVKLVPGDNVIKLTVTDGYTEFTKTLTIKYSNIPVIIINSPLDSASVTSDTVTIKGTVLNAQNNGLLINGGQVSFDSKNGNFSHGIKLKNLTNDIEIRAVNGRLTTVKNLRIYYSGTPAINVSSPLNGVTVNSADVIFEGTVFPANPLQISSFTIGGVDCKASVTDGTFRTVPITLAKSGETKIDLILETTDSRKVTRTITLNYNDGPDIDIWSPLEGSNSYSNVVKIKGKISRADSDSFMVGDTKGVVNTDGSFSQTYTLKEGKNEIKLSAGFGKTTATKTLTVYYSPVLQEGAEVRLAAADGSELTAFEDMVKVKLAKGSLGSGTTCEISVEDPSDVDPPPVQSAFIGPLFRLKWDGFSPVRPYKVVLKYDDVVNESQSHKVSVFFFDTGEDEWNILGGTVDARTKTVSVETDKEGYFAAAVYFVTFDDIRNHWSRRDVEFLAAKGAVTGRPGSFKPDSTVTRAEFITFLVKTLGLQIYKQERPSYRDVGKSHWAYDYIETALRAGIVSGLSNRSFGPDRPLTREEAASIVMRAANLKPVKEQELNKILSNFKDVRKVSNWAKSDVAAAVKAKLLSGSSNGLFNPGGSTTRGQAAAMIARLAELNSKRR